MSHVVDHVTEAQLHAYLDRDLEFADPEIRNAMGAHIADCSRCSALLKEVRQVYTASNDLLEVTAPPARPTPSFEEIVKRAAARQSSANEADTSGSRFLRSQDPPGPETTDEFTVDIPTMAPVADDEFAHTDDKPEEIVDRQQEEEPETVDLPPIDLQLEETPTKEVDQAADVMFLEPAATTGESAFPQAPVEDDQTVMDPVVPEEEINQDLVDPVARDEQAFPPTLQEIQPTVIEPDIPSADEVVFIDADTPIVEPEPVTPARVAQEIAPKPKRGRTTRILALAATIVIAVGIGGWFGRPYIMARFGGESSAVTMAASREQNETVAETPAPDLSRQELQESVALNQPGDAGGLAADAPAIASGVGADARGDSFGLSLEDRSAFAETEAVASSIVGRTIVGSVRDAASKRAVTGARVALVETGQVARTDSTGRFQITGVPVGSVSVNVLGAGYERTEKGFTVPDSQGIVADFELRRSSQSVDELDAAPAPARARAQLAPPSEAPLRNDASGWTETSRTQAESLLGGPLVALEGVEIGRIERIQGQSAIRITQNARNGNPIYIQIVSSGGIGNDATLDGVEVTSPEGTMPATGHAQYGNYVVYVEAMVSDVELESLLRRLTLAPDVN